MRALAQSKLALAIGACALALGGCATGGSSGNTLPPATFVGNDAAVTDKYIIGALDTLTIFVWRHPELGAKVQVRPDGRITTPRSTDMPAGGKTPADIQADHKEARVSYM